MTANQESELLIKQLEIVIDHCNETGLRAGGGAVGEAINIIKKREEPVYIGADFPTKKEREARDARNSG